jgi:hypothetical protein
MAAVKTNEEISREGETNSWLLEQAWRGRREVRGRAASAGTGSGSAFPERQVAPAGAISRRAAGQVLVGRNRDIDQLWFGQVELAHQLDEIVAAPVSEARVVALFPANGRHRLALR